MKNLLTATLACALCAAAPLPKGFDSDYPKSWPERAYRQSKLNVRLKQLGWPYRIYQSYDDGSCLAARYDADRQLRSLRGTGGSPSLAFGCERLPAEASQKLAIYGDMIVLARADGKIFTAAEDPYRQVGRYESGPGKLVVNDRARVPEILRVILPDRGAEYSRRVERELARKIHAMGDGRMVELDAEAADGRWRYRVKTDDQRAGDPAELFFEDGEASSSKKDASLLDDDGD